MGDRNNMEGAQAEGAAGQQRYANAAGSAAPQSAPRQARVPYQRHVPHTTQPPIDDVDPEYVMPERYTTLEPQVPYQPGAPRRHMGVATSDPQYLPPTGNEERETRIHQPHGTRTAVPTALPSKQNQGGRLRHSGRYLQTPRTGKAIFTSQRDRQRQQVRSILAVLIVLAVVLALVWWFILR